MLTARQIELADILLTHLDSKGGRSHKTSFKAALRDKGAVELEIHSLIKILKDDYLLIDRLLDSETYLILRSDGNKAAKIGIAKYLEQLDSDKQLDKTAKKASIRGVDTAISNSKKAIWIAVVVPIVLALLQIGFQYKYQVNNTARDRNKNGDIGSDNDFSNFPINQADTIFVEKLKYSLKHDSVFINDIKQLINSDTTKN